MYNYNLQFNKIEENLKNSLNIEKGFDYVLIFTKSIWFRTVVWFRKINSQED